jgi:hypothetical protein
MKKLFVILTLLCSTALAKERVERWYEMQNRDGSRVMLHTQKKCTEAGFVAAYIAPNGKVTAGCWNLLTGMVYVEWDNGEIVAYEQTLFSRKEQARLPR